MFLGVSIALSLVPAMLAVEWRKTFVNVPIYFSELSLWKDFQKEFEY